jgi:hypothetical protein
MAVRIGRLRLSRADGVNSRALLTRCCHADSIARRMQPSNGWVAKFIFQRVEALISDFHKPARSIYKHAFGV